MERENEKSLILVYATDDSPRLQYILKYLFEEICGAALEFTHDLEKCRCSTQKKICYAKSKIIRDALHIKPFGLLTEHNIRSHHFVLDKWNDLPIFFQTDGDIPFDLFSASFFLVTRYEEYCLQQKDVYGRFDHQYSLAYQHNFIQLPLIELWVAQLCNILGIKRQPSFQFQLSYDVDQAWCWKNKGFIRNLGGLIRDLLQIKFHAVINRLNVLFRRRADPFDVFQRLNELHHQHGLLPIYFFLLASKNGKYDKHILPEKPALRSLVEHISSQFSTGIHPSWAAHTSDVCLKDELKTFMLITKNEAVRSRYHYLAFSLPNGYRRLLDNGIKEDYSMGYGTINGFRASTSIPFRWYDLSLDEETELWIHPFCWMDANSFYQAQLKPKEALYELRAYKRILEGVSGRMLVIWHNNFLGADPQFAGWREVHEQFLQER
ncbi:MAG: DUF7033 domain-containing protein [Chitinophagaceae bacterium]|jgi:hypothetical protein